MIGHSVLINCHNQAPFIADCVESLLAQTEPPDEIIAYDRGSSDGSVDILRRYGDKVRLIAGHDAARQAHVAELHAVQTAFAASHGRLIFLLDGADRFKPEKVARYTAAFENHPDASLVQAPLDEIDEHGAAFAVNLEPRKHVTNHLREIYRRHDVNFFYPTSALAFSRYYIERVMPLDLSDGLPLWIDSRLCITAAYFGRIVTLPDPLTDWRRIRKPDATRTRPGMQQVRQTLMRARVFNEFCRRHGLRTISPWRSRRLYLQLLCSAVSEPVYNRVRPLIDRVE